LSSPADILDALRKGHDVSFCLLWAFKALCFINGGKTMYEALEATLRTTDGFDAALYAKTVREEVANG